MSIENRTPLKNGYVLDGKYGKYFIDSIKGYGGSSLVYNGKKDNVIPVLIKELFPIYDNNFLNRSDNGAVIITNFDKSIMNSSNEEVFKDAKTRAINEVELHTKLSEQFYPYNQLVYDCFEANNTIYTIFENKDNGSVLSDEPKQNFMTYMIYTKRILEALSPLHSAGYLHLDISPDNIYKTRMGADEPILRLIDFNSAIELSSKADIKYIYSKYDFAPYEVKNMKIDKISYASDIYSVGACLFHWLSGRSPNVMDSMNPMLIDSIDSNTQLPVKILQKCNIVLQKALQSDARNRYQSADEMLGDITEILTALNGSNGYENVYYTDLSDKLDQIEGQIRGIKDDKTSGAKSILNNKNRKAILIILLLIFTIPVIVLSINYIIHRPQEITKSDGSVYFGEYLSGAENGYGVMNYANGDKYEGEWKDGLWNGEGTLIADGCTYKGGFINGVENGYAEISYDVKKNLSDVEDYRIVYYKGEIENELMHGYGEAEYANGNVYKGEFEQGYYNGIGEYYTYRNGDGWTYSGTYELGMQKRGTLKYHTTGTSFYGDFDNNGYLSGQGRIQYDDGFTIEGYFIDWKLEGRVKLIRPDGSVAYAEYEKGYPIEDIVYMNQEGEIVEVVPHEQVTTGN